MTVPGYNHFVLNIIRTLFCSIRNDIKIGKLHMYHIYSSIKQYNYVVLKYLLYGFDSIINMAAQQSPIYVAKVCYAFIN